MYQRISHCRACASELPPALLDYDMVPIADALSSRAHDHRDRAPLALHRCPACGLLQLACHLEPASIFNQHYPYFSSEINALVERMARLAWQLVDAYSLNRDSSVIEIASNDGYLLQHFQALKIPVYGIEPSRRQAELAKRKHIDTLCGFFGAKVAAQIKLQRGGADLIIANNVVAHVPDINDFISGIASLLNEGGTAVFEFHYALRMIEDCQFDTLYHQHIYYYTLSSFSTLLQRHGLMIKAVEPIDSYGGSLRIHADHSPEAGAKVQELLVAEAKTIGEAALTHFADQSMHNSHAIRKAILDIKQQGKKIAAYGAAAKATTLIAVCQLDEQQLDYVVDQNPHKHGLYMPGTGLRVYPVSMLEQNTPDYILILAWNYAPEIMQQLSWFSDQGGDFIIPIPILKIN